MSAAKRQYDKLGKQMQSMQDWYDGGNIEASYEASVQAEKLSEKLTLLMRALPAYTGNPQARFDVEENIAQTIPVEIGFTEAGWFHLRMPILLPRKEKQPRDYIRAFLYPPMREFFGKLPLIRYHDCVLIFRHVYHKDRPEREFRDHDNIELNVVTDIIAQYALKDDAPLKCRHYYCSTKGSQERTEVYVVPQAEFGQWLDMEETIPEEGLPLTEKPCWMA
ncbi:MAG: hypothetical protein IJX67_12245 [Oscillospiraceae bacterium]|nr:hypothetical protein [Oscillospiraceae bacterium]